ncbi:heat shock protein 70 (HSP70)-interacting protein, putative [Ricinus communis]|uniref:Heat shock protein 70 (HSP70)-interacting protein, putative n=1 Tax=Ricinus communis TaxID=3988 RepID=B9T5B5_RICCO|nr:heat shock protein 70 (HSP70)-interacting protein, putative [Ricinus communis]|eukprot:XP_002533434.1 tetratricopeptide repeat protein 1 [Ricinus communis]
MVVIEAEEVSSSSSKTTTHSTKETETIKPAAETNMNGNDSDGFETASEREVSDNEDQQVKENPDSNQNDYELKQKEALEEANEAKLEGNKVFGEGKYEEALLKYEVALQVAPEIPSSVELRSICHSNRGVCFLKLGKYEDTIKECTKALELNSSYIKALLRRGEAHEKLEHFEEAIADMKKILELDPSNDQAKKAIYLLEPLAAIKREKMKEEMIGKLKELGNNVLGRFGMSVDNFKAVKDPNTGSYSVSFQR